MHGARIQTILPWLLGVACAACVGGCDSEGPRTGARARDDAGSVSASFGRPPDAALGCTSGRCAVLDDEDAGALPAGGCADAFGQCTPRLDTPGFDCVCQDAITVSWEVAARCECALFGCAPACSSGSGACYPRPDGFECRCAGADVVAVDLEQGAWGCAAALDSTCGPPPRGERCEQLAGAGVVACEADGSGGWECDCDAAAADAGPEPLAAPTAPDATGAGTFLCGGPGTFMAVNGRPLTCAAAIWTHCGI